MKKTNSKTYAILAVMAAIAMVGVEKPCQAKCHNHPLIEQSMVIKAPPKLVFEGIQQSRSEDPERRRMLSKTQDTAVIDEQLTNLPVLGTAHLVYKEIEVPYQRIDYELVSSDKLKHFEGSWELTPLDNGHETKVSLKSYSEVKVWVPFAREMSAAQCTKDINRRLSNLKRWCTHNQDQIAQRNVTKSLNVEECSQAEKQSD